MDIIQTKKIIILLVILFGVLTVSWAEKNDDPVKPVLFTDVDIDDSFWAPRLEINRTVTIPHAIRMCEKTNALNSSVMYKVIESAAYTLAKYQDNNLEEFVTRWINKNVPEILPDKSGKTWKELGWENNLYAAGHFFEAAVACFQSLGNKKILDAAIQIADYLDSIFGPGKRYGTPSHQEIEVGLVKLYRLTGNDRYLKLAKFFLDQRGRALDFFGRRLYGAYSQDHKPVTQQMKAVGHAVKATYMYMGMTDVAALTGTDDYMASLHRIWEDIVTKKIHVTGNIGCRRLFEGFGEEYELPNFTCWNETCAAIGNIMWNHRLFLLKGDAKYNDVIERTLYNGFLVGVSLSGDRFFYQNLLKSFGDFERSAWFGVPCCPPNVTRLMASLGSYIYAKSGEDIYINLFIGSQAKIKTDGNTIQVTQETKYPWEGAVKLTIYPDHTGEFMICVRIPGWAQDQPMPGNLYRYMKKSDKQVTIKVNGKSQKFEIAKGFAKIKRKWNKNDVIELDLPMPVRRVLAHEKVKDDQGKVALERGPVVYCAEWPDNGGKVLSLLIPDDAKFESEYRTDLLKGVMVISGKVLALSRGKNKISVKKKKHKLVAIPYYAWANRGKGEMAVWLARDEFKVKLPPVPTIASTSQVSSSPSLPSGAPGIENYEALFDQMEPFSSSDGSFSYFRLIPKENNTGWVQYDFKEPAQVSSVEVYWVDDNRFCKIPESWRVLYRVGENWKPVKNHGPYGVERDTFNKVSFDPVKTDGLRLEIKPKRRFYFDFQIGPPDGSFVRDGPVEWYECGIIEWRVK